MAGKKAGARIEPSFAGAPGAMPSVRAEDRMVAHDKGRGRGRKGARGRKPKRRGFLFRAFFRLGYWGVVFSLWGVIAAGVLVAFYGAKMPSAHTWAVPDRPPNVKILARDGTLLANRGVMGGEALPLSAMSPYLAQAVVAIEDRRFRSHWGVDPLGLARALIENLTQGRVAQGGSTITQQLAKNLFLEPERTLERKVQEVLLAFWLEHEFSKDQILEMYLNRVYFGSGAYGAEAAARRYFGKSAREVDLREAALLAGLLKAPSRLSPARDPQAAEERAQLVLEAMREQGFIGDRMMAGAIAGPEIDAPATWTGSEHYVADRVMDALPALIGDVRADVVVETTVDRDWQEAAEEAVGGLLREEGRKLNVSQGALVAIANDGAVRALVGGADYGRSPFDRASHAKRQPGSAFKPFLFLGALEKGLTPGTVREDAPVRIGKWRPENHKGEYFGPVTLTAALARSLNSVAARLMAETGPKAVVSTAHRLGIVSDLPANASIALGTAEVTPLELTAAYVPFANGGFRPEIHTVTRVTTPGGKVLYERKPQGARRVVSAEALGQMNRMMAETIRSGSGRKAAIGRPAGGKTGTTQNARDAWFVGYTASLTAGVWFGNDDGAPMGDVTGGSLPTLAWKAFMEAAHEGVATKPLPGADAAPAPQPGNEAAPMATLDMPSALDARPVSTARAPRPPAEVGAPRKSETTLMDIILGQ
ncbi:MAG TPA: transglycosylase domain-containing protein [Mesorhizobium sp.]|jgi:penicillin-binding protein 1A|nr:transglycosylase domain-containing protein [Mesorhizobium sp.]